MVSNTILFFSMLIIFCSCNGQNTLQAAGNLNEAPVVAEGDTVLNIDKNIATVFQDRDNNYWFGSDGKGVYRYDGKTIIHFTSKDGLCHNQIRVIQEDKYGNIYFSGTGLNGISKFDGKAFITLTATGNKSSGNEWKLQPDDLWFPAAQDSGKIYRYDGKKLYCLQFPKTKAGEGFKTKFPRSRFPNMVFNPYDVYGIFKDKKGNIWFGTSSLGVCRYDGKAFKWITGKDLNNTPVRSISEDKDGNLWFGNSSEGVYRYDGKDLMNFRKEKGIGNVKGVPYDAAVSYMAMVVDNSGELWISTFRSGVWRYNGKNVTHYPIENGETVTSFSMYKDRLGGLWLGTNEDGAYKFNGHSFIKFNINQ